MTGSSKFVDSGGFGCVFAPELQCKKTGNKNKNKNATRKISKLMLKRYADEEYDYITKVKNKINSIENNEKYFVLQDVTKCEPAPLPNTVLRNFNKSCKVLARRKEKKKTKRKENGKRKQKENITKKSKYMFNEANINNNLSKLSVISMPHAGLALDEYIRHKPSSLSNFKKINNKMIELFQRGIVPMNKKGVYHSDIKSANIMISESIAEARLIDWGLCVLTNGDITSLPDNWNNRPFQFNVPFESIFLNKTFTEELQLFLENTSDDVSNIISNNEGYIFVMSFINKWCENRGKGHLPYISYILHMLELIDDDNHEYTKDYITEYLLCIVTLFVKITGDGKISLNDYLNTVYKAKIDIWGFLVSYLPIFEKLHKNKDLLSGGYRTLYYELKYILLDYLYLPKQICGKEYEINVPELIARLHRINKYLEINEGTMDDEEFSDLSDIISTTAITRSPT